MKRLLVSHLDLDGWGSVVIYLYFKEKGVLPPELEFDKYMIVDYGWEKLKENIDYVCSFDEVIMADMSVPEDIAKEIRAKGVYLRMFDHHLSSEWLKNDSNSIWDDTRCGTRIFWEDYCLKAIKRYAPILQDFVDIVDTYDCWREDSPLWEEAKGLNAVLYALKNWKAPDEISVNQEFVELMLRKFSLYPEKWVWMPKEQKIIEEAKVREDNLYKQALESMRIRQDRKGRIFGVILLNSKISIVCARILKDKPEMDYIICINSFKGVNGKLSYRTRRPDFDLNSLAGVHGHAVASGGTVLPETAKKIWEDDYVPVYVDEPEYDETSDFAEFVYYNQDDVWF